MRYTLALLAAAVAVQAAPAPMPQGVTAKISPSGAAPSGCTTNYMTFGIAVMNVTASSTAKAAVSTISDGQPQATTGSAVKTISDGQPQATTGSAVKTISDGQPQATVMTMAPVSQITDGQIQGGMHTVMMMPVAQISDGQIQNTVTYMAVTTIVDGQPQAPTLKTSTATAVKTISDGQPQASTGSAVKTISDGQPQVSTGSAIKTISDGQPQASTGSAVKTLSDGQPQASTATKTASSSTASATVGAVMVACNSSSTLSISLAGGVLTDNLGRTGYIASNYQFQFDKPPQAGAIYTAGWSVCANGTLTLGGSSIFYQCLSGNFYNLYNEKWAAQCSPVYIDVLQLVNCS